jgi:hypothetical protein
MSFARSVHRRAPLGHLRCLKDNINNRLMSLLPTQFTTNGHVVTARTTVVLLLIDPIPVPLNVGVMYNVLYFLEFS